MAGVCVTRPGSWTTSGMQIPISRLQAWRLAWMIWLDGSEVGLTGWLRTRALGKVITTFTL